MNALKDPFSRYQLITTYAETLLHPVLYNLASKGSFDEAMSYLEKCQPPCTIPVHYKVLSDCGFVVQEDEQKVRLISKAERSTVMDIDNDPVGSGSAALKLAAITFAQTNDGEKYMVDFTTAERKRDVEHYTQGDITYEQYCEGNFGGTVLPEYEGAEFFDEEFSVTVTADRNLRSLYPLDADSLNDVYQHFKGTNFALSSVVRLPETVNFPLHGHERVVVGKMVHLIPLRKKITLAKGPEHDELIDRIVKIIKHHAVIGVEKVGEAPPPQLGQARRRAAAVAPELAAISYTRDDGGASEGTELSSLFEERPSLGVKYSTVKRDFENCRENLQTLRDSLYGPMMVAGFRDSKGYKNRITKMRNQLAGNTFATMALEGMRQTKEYLTSTAYHQSVGATPGMGSFINADYFDCLSIFLDVVIKSPAQFPAMQRGADGEYRFLTGIGSPPKVDPNRDPFELYRKFQAEEQNRGPGEQMIHEGGDHSDYARRVDSGTHRKVPEQEEYEKDII